MTTTETDAPAEETPDTPPADDAAGEGAPPEPPALEAGGSGRNEPLWTRGILPLALPFLSAFAMAIWVINLSRAFITGGGTGALVIVMIITVTIMAGAAMMSAAERLRTGSAMMLVAALLMIVVTAGIITLGPSDHEPGGEGGGFTPAKGPAVATLDVTAGPGTKFDSKSYTLSASGVIEIVYEGQSGHTLAIDDPKFAGFLLKSPGPDKTKVQLDPGEYTIYCTVPGHRPGGMEATVTVPEASSSPEPTTTTTQASS